MTLPPPTARMKSTPRVRHNAAERNVGDAGRVQRGVDPVEQAAFFGAPAAEVHEHLAAVLRLYERADLIFRPLAEYDLCGGVKHEIVHVRSSLQNGVKYAFHSIRL